MHLRLDPLSSLQGLIQHQRGRLSRWLAGLQPASLDIYWLTPTAELFAYRTLFIGLYLNIGLSAHTFWSLQAGWEVVNNSWGISRIGGTPQRILCPSSLVLAEWEGLVRWKNCRVATHGDLTGLTWIEVTEHYYFCQWCSEPFQNYKVPRHCLISFQSHSSGEQQTYPPDSKRSR